MYFPDDTLAYLQGEKYSNALAVQFIFDEEDLVYRTQIDLLCEMAAGKNVIHVGCVDHNIETVKHKIKRRKWLHGRLCQSAARCHGIDIQEEGIRYIKDKLGFQDSSCIDIFSDRFMQLAKSDNWDYLLIPEVLEHIEAPTNFLRAIARKYKNDFTKLILTVPNGISLDNYRLARDGSEIINSDHRFWFTPYTTAKTIINAGLDFERIVMCRHGTINRRALWRNRFFRKHPLLRNDILCIASLR
jgi:2-polyprenyl-3-methyl-5-hydroxy-6-metoxy-1,4-benzoquinol methylase